MGRVDGPCGPGMFRRSSKQSIPAWGNRPIIDPTHHLKQGQVGLSLEAGRTCGAGWGVSSATVCGTLCA